MAWQTEFKWTFWLEAKGKHRKNWLKWYSMSNLSRNWVMTVGGHNQFCYYQISQGQVMISNRARKVIPISTLLCDAIISKPSDLWYVLYEGNEELWDLCRILNSILHSPLSLQSTSDRHQLPPGKSRPETPRKEVLRMVHLSCILGFVLLYRRILDYFLQ